MSRSAPASARSNVHGTALLIADRGILITGPSGSGKSTLALALIGRLGGGRFCRLIADDQVFVSAHGGRLICHAPRTIAGLIEVFGIGPQEMASEKAAVIDLVAHLVPETGIARLQQDAYETISGCFVPCLDLPARNVVSAVQMLCAWLKLPPFGTK